jgi:hypothetical protein
LLRQLKNENGSRIRGAMLAGQNRSAYYPKGEYGVLMARK